MTKQGLKIVFFLICTITISLSVLRGQDVHFSQFNNAPLYLNPAFTGISNYEHRMGLNYRNQWGSVLGADAFNTMSAYYDRRIPNTREDQFGIGGIAFGDVAGSARLGFYYAAISGSYARTVAGNRYRSYKLVVGANAGLGQYSIKRGNLRWPSQFDDNGTFDPDAGTGVNIAGTSNPFLDLGAGILFYGLLDQDMYLYRKTNFYVGAAAFHANQPRVSFDADGDVDDTKAQLRMKYVFHGGLEYGLNDQLSIIPSTVLLFQGKSTEVNANFTTRLLLDNKLDEYQALDFGLGMRMVNNYDQNEAGDVTRKLGMDAIIFSTRIDYGRYSIGLSYDYNISELRAISNGQEGIELSFQYLIEGDLQTNIYSPRF